MLFLDASALVKRYIEEEGSEVVAEATAGQPVAISRLSATEVASAICRRCREGDMGVEQREAALLTLDAERSSFHVVEFTEEITTRAAALLRRHPLRASDSVQLASCLLLADELGTPARLVAFDDRLADAAQAEGVECLAGGRFSLRLGR